MAYLGRYLQFPVLSTITATSLTEFKNSSDAVVVGYIAAEDSSSKGQFELLASTMHPEYVFGISNDLTLAKLEQAYVPGLVVYIENDKERTALPLMDDLDEMVVNVRKAARPLIVDLVLEVHKNLLDVSGKQAEPVITWKLLLTNFPQMGIPFGYVFASSLEERVRLRKELKSLARKYRQNIQFGIADPVAVGSIVKDLHLDFSSLPAFAIREPVANLRYPMNKPTGIFSDALEGFVQDYLDGKLQPTIKSEPIPGKSEDGVVKVVGLTYQEIVMDETRDVLLIYCIASCGPCDALHPTLVALAKLFASSRNLEEKVTIAKIMYDANDTPERGIIGFPTIKLFPAASKSAPVTFFGDRTFDALANFIRDHGTHKGDLLDSEEN